MAAKCLKKSKVHVGGAAEFLQESNVIQSIDHAHIVRLFGVVLGTDSYILVSTRSGAELQHQITGGWGNFLDNLGKEQDTIIFKMCWEKNKKSVE